MNLKQTLTNIVASQVNQVAFFLFVLLCFYMPAVYLPYDKNCFQTWCLFIFENGLTQAYHCPDPEMNYPPMMCYMLWLFGKFQGSHEHIVNYFQFFKAYGLLFDFAGALLVLRLVSNKKLEILFLLLLIANPIFIYNSYLWGQLDSILAFFAFASLYFLLKENLLAADVCFLLILNLKPQAIVFAPPLLLLSISQFYGKITWRKIATTILACVFIQLALLLPFILKGEMSGIINVYLHAVGYHPKISVAAFNAWVFLLGKGCFDMSDEIKFGLFSYKQFGFLLFFVASILALLPLFLVTLSKFFFRGKFILTNNLALLSFALIPLLFFFFNTEMHERYSHPAMIFIAAYSFRTKRVFLFLLFCFAYFCNMEPRLYGLGFPNYNILIFDPYFVASLFAVLIASLYFFLYQDFLKNRIQIS